MITDLFSKRQTRLRGEGPDVYRYDELPPKLRVQITNIVTTMLTGDVELGFSPIFASIHARCNSIIKTLYHEHGIPQPRYDQHTSSLALIKALISESNDIELVLDCIELCAMLALPAQAGSINELNFRFKEHGIGYQFEGDQLVRVDSDLIHTEAVKPALRLLGTKNYAGPHKEFLNAYDHYREKRFEASLVEANKAIESTMRAICDAKGWDYGKAPTAKALTELCITNKLVDSFWQDHFERLKGLLGGIATARNKLGGHGQGSQPREVPRTLASYVLHMTASTIVFLIESADA